MLLPLVLAACSSGSGSGSGSPTTASGGATPLSNGQLGAAGTTVLNQMDAYTSSSAKCTYATSPVVCVEAADRTLGGQIHTYANLLAVGHGFHAPAGIVSTA